MKPFDLEKALAGEPVFHLSRNLHVENVTKVGNRLAFTIPLDGDVIYSATLTGEDFNGYAVLVMKPKTRTFFINLYDSPSFHYSKHLNRESAASFAGRSYTGRVFPKLNKEPIEITVEV